MSRKLHCKGQSAEGVGIRLFKGEGLSQAQVEGRCRAGYALGPCKRQLNGQLHVGRAHLGDNGAVGKFHHGVNYALRVDKNGYVLGLNGEKVHGLDEFKTLVHKCSRVDGYFCAHAPVGVLERVGAGNVSKLVALSAAERPAAGGDDKAL